MAASGDLETARLALADLALPLPPVPDALAGDVGLVKGGWGTGGPDIGLIFVEQWIEAVEADPQAEFVRFGTSGYAERSQGVVFNVAHGRLVALLAADPEDPARVREQWDGAARAIAAAEGDGPRLLVVDHHLAGPSRWTWLGGEWEWHASTPAAIWDEVIAALAP